MYEQDIEPIAIANLDAYCGRPEDSARRQEYIDRRLIPTNNLCMYFFDTSQHELAPGIPNPYDYRRRAFGDVLQRFRDTFPELWEEGRQAAEVRSAAMSEFVHVFMSSGEEAAAEQKEAAARAIWKKEEVFTRIYQLLVPELEASGIRPLDICA